MKTTTLRTPVAVLAFAVLSLPTSGRAQSERVPRGAAADPIAIPMTADRWETKENAEFLRQLGFFHGLMRLNSGNAVLKGNTFSDGTIEFDVNTIGRGSPGIAFRQQDDDTFELLYLRPDPACPAFRACMQYAPQTHGVLLWDLFPQYQTRAPLRENGWNHIKMVVSGRRMNVFVNDVPSPTLTVGRLEGDTMTGALRLQGPGTFANMVITPGAVDGLSPEPAGDPLSTDRGLVRQWRLSHFSALPNGQEVTYANMPGGSAEWQALSTERNGLVNISRIYGRPLPQPNRAVAWLKTTITSDRKQTKNVDIGWTRELWMFVNGKLVYADKNLFEVEGSRKFPDARCSLENGAAMLPLEPGENEIAVALANNFFGWGLMLRVANPEGVQVAGAPGKVPKLGEKAPPFSLLDLEGQRVTLEGELTHGPVVLVLLRGWPGYQCPFCTRQFADFLGHAPAFEAAGARVVWVYPGPSDSVQQHAREFLANRALPSAFRITTDPDYVFTNAYGLRWDAPQETAYPATFVIDRGATVRFAQISVGHDGRALATDVLKALETIPR